MTEDRKRRAETEASEDASPTARTNEELEEEVQRRTAQVRLLQDVAVLANEARSVEEAFSRALERIGRANGWHAGRAFVVEADGRATPAGEVWADEEALAEEMIRGGFDPEGSIVDRVLESGEPQWTVADAPTGTKEGERSRFAGGTVLALPVRIGDRVVRILELYSKESLRPDAELLGIMGDIGTQLGRIVEREEAERRVVELARREQETIGAELHDTVGQTITGLGMLAQSCLHSLEGEGHRCEKDMELLLAELEKTHDQIRALSWGLVSIRVEGEALRDALDQLVRHHDRLYEAACELEIDPELSVEDGQVATSIFRIAREAVHNALRHSGSDRVVVRLRRERDRFRLEITDEGSGMEIIPWTEGVGLSIMSQRARMIDAKLDVHSTPGEGTVVVCEGPLDGDRPGGTSR